MGDIKHSVPKWITGTICLVMISLLGAAPGDEARVEGIRRGNDDDRDLFIEVVEYSDGVTICAVHANDKTPGRCHRGGVSSESNSWHGNRAKINFDVQVPPGVRFN